MSLTTSINSGTTTNMNTPRSEYTPEHLGKKGEIAVSNLQPGGDGTISGEDRDTIDARSSTCSDESRHRACNIQSTWPSKVAIKTQALVSWQVDRRLENIFLNINWAPRGKGQKRRRSYSESESGSDHQPMSRAAVNALVDTRLATHKREVAEILAAHKDQVLQLLDNLKTELDQKLDAREERLVVDRLTDLVAEKVQEEMVEVEENLMENITSMPLQASLTFPDHLLY